MKTYIDIVKSYAKALKDNDYEAIIKLFSKEAKVFSSQAGIKPPPTFFKNLFDSSSRNEVEVKNIFIGVENKNMVAANINLKVMLDKKLPIEFEAVDLFEFDSENKIKELKIVLDTYPIRVLREEFLP